MRTRGFAFLAALALLITACSAGPGTGGQLEGTDWVLRSFQQDGELTIVPDGLYADANFGTQRVNGYSGCNTYNAVYRAGGRTLLISQAAVTFMACSEEQMAFEQTYLGLLQDSRFYTARTLTLTVFGSGGEPLLVFDAAPRNPLRGAWQVTDYQTSPGSVSAVLPGTEMDVTFGLTTVSGFAGCNSFSGTYGTNSNIVRVGMLATTRLACEQAVMDQETAFLNALQGLSLVDRRGPSLFLTDLSGSIKVGLAKPSEEAAASPSPGASEKATPTAPASEKPTEKPTPTPTATPAPTQTPAPTATPRPSLPPIELPATAECTLASSDGTPLATIAYLETWFTVSEPPDLACRYFDPAEITVPADPTTLVTAVMAGSSNAAYADAVASATDPATWEVHEQLQLVVGGQAATMVEAQAVVDADGVPAGSSRFAYLIDLGSNGTLMLWTTSAAPDETYASNAAVVSLMVAVSSYDAAS